MLPKEQRGLKTQSRIVSRQQTFLFDMTFKLLLLGLEFFSTMPQGTYLIKTKQRVHTNGNRRLPQTKTSDTYAVLEQAGCKGGTRGGPAQRHSSDRAN